MPQPTSRIDRLNAEERECYEIGNVLRVLTADGTGTIMIHFCDGGSRITRSGEYRRTREHEVQTTGERLGRRIAMRTTLFEAVDVIGQQDLPPRVKICTGDGCPLEGVPQTLDQFRKRETDRTPLRSMCRACRRRDDQKYVIDGVRQKTPGGTRRRA